MVAEVHSSPSIAILSSKVIKDAAWTFSFTQNK
jgi:hypothetical protein